MKSYAVDHESLCILDNLNKAYYGQGMTSVQCCERLIYGDYSTGRSIEVAARVE